MKRYAGCSSLKVRDRSLHLEFPMLVIYPTGVKSRATEFGPYSLDVAMHGEVLPGKHSLVMVSHGSGGSHLVYRNLALYLARQGYIVGLPEHLFNNRNNNEWAATDENMIHRPRHLSLAIDEIIEHHGLRGHINFDRIAIIGHSMGGYTALALAGGIPDSRHEIRQAAENFTPRMFGEIDPDERVKALILLAPAAVWYRSEGALDEVTIPILMLSAEKDAHTPYGHAQIVIDGLKNQTLLEHRVIQNAGHFSFLAPFPDKLKYLVGEPAQDPKGFDRTLFQSELETDVVEFLQRHGI